MLKRNNYNSAISFWGPILIAAIIIIPIYFLFFSDNSTDKPAVETKPGSEKNILDLTPLNPPLHGSIKTNINSEIIAPFEIKTDSAKYYLVKLEDTDDNSKYFIIFIYGGRTVHVNVPLGKYVMKYCNGNKWYGYKELFGPAGSYNKSTDLFNFDRSNNRANGYTITLYAVTSGNLKTRPINRKDF